MTTMFVQQRRVVHLLVLLHFCVCVACAASPSGVKQDSPSIETIDVEKVEREINEGLAKAYKYMVHMSGCLYLLGGKRELCENNSTRAQAIATNATALVKEIEKIKEKPPEGDAWKEEKKAKVQKIINDYGDVRLAIVDITILEETCTKQPWYGHSDRKKLGEAQKLFSEVLKKGTNITLERKRLGEKSSKAIKTLGSLTERLKSPDGELKSLALVVGAMGDADRAVGALKKSLEGVPGLEMDLKETTVEDLKKKVADRNATVTRELEEAKAREYKQLLQLGLVDEKGEVVVRPPKEKEEVGENARQTQEKDKDKEETVVEEHAEKDNSVEGRRKENGNGDDENREGAKEEKAGKKNAGKDGEKAEEEAERAIKAIQDAESLKSQNLLTNASTASISLNVSQLSDNSHGPALVHSPFLLLVLLCVLGCTVVC